MLDVKSIVKTQHYKCVHLFYRLRCKGWMRIMFACRKCTAKKQMNTHLIIPVEYFQI